MKNQHSILLMSILLLAVIFLSGCKSNKLEHPEEIVLENRQDTISYIIGLDYAEGISAEGIPVNKEAIYRGIAEGLGGNPILNDSLKEKYIREFTIEMDAKKAEENKMLYVKNVKAGETFLQEKELEEGVMKKDNGLLMLTIKEGTGRSITPLDSVIMHYRGTFVNGEAFDMSYNRGPATLVPDQLIPGLAQGLSYMREGGIYELYIPHELAYNEMFFANIIPPGSTLIYRIEIIKVYQ